MNPLGPSNARVMVVGDAPSGTDIMRGRPFSSPELMNLLRDGGIQYHECFITNLVDVQPPNGDMNEWLINLKKAPKPDNPKYANKEWGLWKGKWCNHAVRDGAERLARHIKLVKPTLVIVLGTAALFALTGKMGLKTWRGSQLVGTVDDYSFKVIPTYGPAAINKDWSVRSIATVDLKRAKRELDRGPLPYIVPNYTRIIRPNFAQVVKWLSDLRVLLNKGRVLSSTDVETRAGHIACTGFYVKGLPTLCIPWMCLERPEGYWTAAEEQYIWQELQELMTHQNFKVIGQNWFYDAQYKFRFFFKKIPAYWDTMIAQHCMFPGMPKGLDYLASMYCEYYVYWKDDGKNWDPSVGEDQLWAYNCEDCERTYEVYEGQHPIIEKDPRLHAVWDFQTNTLGPLVFNAMCRGIRADVKNKTRLAAELAAEIDKRQTWLDFVAGHHLNFNSPPQLKKFFYDDLKQPPQWNRKAKPPTITTNDEALTALGKREPLLRDLCRVVQELRSIGVFKSTFVEARLDRDQRIRCSFNIGGTITFRLSSSENAFGSGLNLQNVPSGNDDPDPGDLELPNVRKLFIPDEGRVMFDIDLKNADFYTMVWEADDELFRLALEAGVDTHLLNAGMIFEIPEITLERLKDPEFEAYAKKRYAKQRKGAKPWCHGTNYGGKERTMAIAAGITVAESARFAKRYFGEHPGIKRWHQRVEAQINTCRYVENKFGYRYYFFDRLDGALPEALAWVPQSTTGCVINRAWDNITRKHPEAEILIQVHDSLVGQYPAAVASRMLQEIPETAKVVVPYDRPLVIPVGMKVSDKSWGHCA